LIKIILILVTYLLQLSCSEKKIGCTDYKACNYDITAEIDSGNCVYAEDNYNCDGDCIAKIDCSGICGGKDTENIDCAGSCLNENVLLWDVCYNIENTVRLKLSKDMVNGKSIPKDIGKLINLKELRFYKTNLVGNIPKELKFKNTNYIPPTHGKELAQILKNNHFYITASKNEPSGNHHIEAAQCSLPILFINSGGIPEYCNDYGLIFEENNFEDKLNEIYENYEIYYNKILNYPFNARKMCSEYLTLFNELNKRKNQILETRNIKNLKTTNQYLFRIKNLKINK